jgi:hypothetical protein
MRSEVNGQDASSCFLLTDVSRVSIHNLDLGLERLKLKLVGALKTPTLLSQGNEIEFLAPRGSQKF